MQLKRSSNCVFISGQVANTISDELKKMTEEAASISVHGLVKLDLSGASRFSSTGMQNWLRFIRELACQVMYVRPLFGLWNNSTWYFSS